MLQLEIHVYNYSACAHGFVHKPMYFLPDEQPQPKNKQLYHKSLYNKHQCTVAT